MQNPIVRSLERTPVRTRNSNVTRSAWHIEADSDDGSGSITLIDNVDGETFYRGAGIFLGWTQEQLRDAYQSLSQPKDTEPPFEIMQLG